MIQIVPADRSQVRHVLQNLRHMDALEISAGGVDIVRLPDILIRHKVFCFAACDDVEGPVAIWGMIERRRGVGAGFAFGTDLWYRAVIAMLRQIRGFVIPFLHSAGYHRVEAAALAGRADVASLMHLIGARPEGRLQGYGISGEDFISYRWLADEHARYAGQEEAVGSHAAH